MFHRLYYQKSESKNNWLSKSVFKTIVWAQILKPASLKSIRNKKIHRRLRTLYYLMYIYIEQCLLLAFKCPDVSDGTSILHVLRSVSIVHTKLGMTKY